MQHHRIPFLLTLIVCLFAFGIVLYGMALHSTSPALLSVTAPKRIVPAGYKPFSTIDGVSFLYPKTWTVNYFDEASITPTETTYGYLSYRTTNNAYPSAGEGSVTVMSYPVSSDLFSWFTRYKKIDIGPLSHDPTTIIDSATTTATTLFGKPAIIQETTTKQQTEGSPSKAKSVYFSYQDRIWELHFVAPLPDINNLETVFDTMLTTLIGESN